MSSGHGHAGGLAGAELRKDAIGPVVLDAWPIVGIGGERHQQADGDGHHDDAADLQDESSELAVHGYA